MNTCLSVLLLLSSALIVCHSQLTDWPDCSASFDNDPVMQTDSGAVRGMCKNVTLAYRTRPSVHKPVFAWIGIPYAEPPIGANRFKAPVPKAPWNKTLSCKQMAKKCFQFSDKNPYVQTEAESEDCLLLNVFTPARANRTPIVVWIHGGLD